MERAMEEMTALHESKRNRQHTSFERFHETDQTSQQNAAQPIIAITVRPHWLEEASTQDRVHGGRHLPNMRGSGRDDTSPSSRMPGVCIQETPTSSDAAPGSQFPPTYAHEEERSYSTPEVHQQNEQTKDSIW